MKKIIWIIVMLVILGLVVWSGQGVDKPATNTEPIKIGSILILSGEGATWGEAAKNGIDLAIEEVNTAGGISGRMLEVIHEDDRSNPQQAISALNKLTDLNGTKFIIGPNWSNTGVALIEPIKQKGVVVISPSLGVAEFNEASDFIFNIWPHDFILSQHLADYVYKQGHRRVAVVGANDVWVRDQTKAFINKFKELGGTVEFVYEPVVTVTDVRTELAKIKNNKNIDALVLTTDGYSLTVLAAKQARELGITLPFYNITVDKKILADCSQFCEDMIFPTFLTPTKNFEDKYKTKFNRDVEIGADSAYDAVMMLVRAFKETNSTDPQQVQIYLNKIRTYNGVSGSLTADGMGAFTKPYLIKKVQNSESVTVEE